MFTPWNPKAIPLVLYALCVIVHCISDFNLHIPANAILFTIFVAMVVGPIPQDNVHHMQ